MRQAPDTMPAADPESVPTKEESNADPGIARWIPLVVPLAAALIVFGTYVIYAAMLMHD
jgi:hypothetical protein